MKCASSHQTVPLEKGFCPGVHLVEIFKLVVLHSCMIQLAEHNGMLAFVKGRYIVQELMNYNNIVEECQSSFPS